MENILPLWHTRCNLKGLSQPLLMLPFEKCGHLQYTKSLAIHTIFCVRFLYDEPAEPSDAAARAQDEVLASPSPFDSASYASRTKTIVRTVFPIYKLFAWLVRQDRVWTTDRRQ
jgi:hypothetical protein